MHPTPNPGSSCINPGWAASRPLCLPACPSHRATAKPPGSRSPGQMPPAARWSLPPQRCPWSVASGPSGPSVWKVLPPHPVPSHCSFTNRWCRRWFCGVRGPWGSALRASHVVETQSCADQSVLQTPDKGPSSPAGRSFAHRRPSSGVKMAGRAGRCRKHPSDGLGNRVSKGAGHRLAGTAQALIPGPEAGGPGLGAVPGWPGHCRGGGRSPQGGIWAARRAFGFVWVSGGAGEETQTLGGEGGLHRHVPLS